MRTTKNFSWALAIFCAACTGGLAGPGGGRDDDRADGDDAPGPGGQNGDTPERPIEGAAFACHPDKETATSARIWRLTREQFDNTVKALLGRAPGDVPEGFLSAPGRDGFLNNAGLLSVRDSEASSLRLLVKPLAAAAVADDAGFARLFAGLRDGCGIADTGKDDCARAFVAGFGQRAFRRPLDESESDGYLELYQLAEAGARRRGAQVVIEAMLQSPHFLYRSELGDDDDGQGRRLRLDPWETASLLSYFLWNSMPDADLMAAAAAGRLSTPAEIERQARRLLDDPQARPALASFFAQYLEYEGVLTTSKDAERFPSFAALRADMIEEMRRFVTDVAFDGEGTLDELFLASHTVATPALAELYGVEIEGAGWQRVSLDSQQRAGVLTQAGLMAHLSALERTSPVNRGRFVQERLFCTHVPDPPGDVNTAIPALEDGLTRRQQLEAMTRPAACSGCHGIMNGIGFGLENLDAVGRFRAEEDNGTRIDAAGVIEGTDDSDGAFEGPRGLARVVARSKQVGRCFTAQTLRYALGRAESERDGCALQGLHAAFVDSGFDLQALLLAVATSDAFVHRTR